MELWASQTRWRVRSMINSFVLEDFDHLGQKKLLIVELYEYSKEVSRLLLGLNCGEALETIDLPESAKALSSQHDFDLQPLVIFNYEVVGKSNKMADGGGQLYVPPGRWLTGSFNLTTHFTLYLDKEAVLLGSQDVRAEDITGICISNVTIGLAQISRKLKWNYTDIAGVKSIRQAVKSYTC
ncbi:hypothetical protein K2173_002852 [Erythroxylum novogranatense]|uniref:PLD phosphodiesterase domain-containing protein n=1 Tax=Erythroxylum novogranatense TaxID=1862640 RepID=A0AAV8SQ43_9ROSI|nr:hypothetical protein K2173_002852 [Erythroxylum novogranatense]